MTTHSMMTRAAGALTLLLALAACGPNRNARIALLHYLDGEKAYIIAPKDGATALMIPLINSGRDVQALVRADTVNTRELKVSDAYYRVPAAGGVPPRW